MELAESSAARVRIMDFHKKVLSFRSANKQIPRITTLYGPCKMSIHEHRTFFFSPVYTCPFLDSFSPSEAKSIGLTMANGIAFTCVQIEMKIENGVWQNSHHTNVSKQQQLQLFIRSLAQYLACSFVAAINRSIERTAVPIREQYKLLFSKVVLTRWAKWKELSKEAE